MHVPHGHVLTAPPAPLATRLKPSGPSERPFRLQVVALTAAASASAGVELSTAATVVHPYSLRLWQQRQRLLAMRPAGGQQPAVAAQEMQKRGLAPPPPWQHQSAAVWGAPSP